jgi:hypothetical protein
VRTAVHFGHHGHAQIPKGYFFSARSAKMTPLLAASLLLFWAALIATEPVHDKIVVAMDIYPGRSPTLSQQKASATLLEFIMMNTTYAVSPDVDVALAAEWAHAFRILDNTPHPLYKTLFGNSPSLIDMLLVKAKWKDWMASIGLGGYVPHPIPYNESEAPAMVFPVILKTDWVDGHPGGHGSAPQAGTGVHIVRDHEQLINLANKISSHGSTFFLEEALTGMGLGEMCSYGSVYRGQLLSSRCTQRTFTPNHIAQAKGNAEFDTKGTKGPFIKGPTLSNDDDYPVPCGTELVSVVSNMFAHTNFTGIYCGDWKLDHNMRLKLMEVNPRFCGTLRSTYGDALLLASVVPLAFAALEANSHDSAYTSRSALLHGKYKATFQRIRELEIRALATGGGYIGDTWHGAVTYDMNKHLSSLMESYRVW